jgi:LPS export ABC transporter protein LptC
MFKIKYQSSRLFNLLTVIILSLLCVLLNYLTRIDFHRLTLPKNKPEFASTGILANLFSKNGKLLYRAMAESGLQYPDSSKIILSNLNMQAFSESTELLQEKLTSNDGWLDTANSLGYLGESVVLTVSNVDPKYIINAYTKHVHLDAKRQFIYSSAPIRATRGKSTMTGIGFSVDYTKQLLTIESNVRIIYEK